MWFSMEIGQRPFNLFLPFKLPTTPNPFVKLTQTFPRDSLTCLHIQLLESVIPCVCHKNGITSPLTVFPQYVSDLQMFNHS